MSESCDMADPCSSRGTEDGTRLRHRSVQRLLPAALLTCVVALYNHFPLTYPDTGGYLENAFALAHGRAPWVAGARLAFAIGCHLSHFPLYGMLVVATLAGRILVDRASRSWRRCVPLALRAVAPLVVAAGLVIGSNYYFNREPVLSRSS